MSATLLEVTRSLHEDLERFQQAIIDEIEYPPRNVSFELHLTPFASFTRFHFQIRKLTIFRSKRTYFKAIV